LGGRPKIFLKDILHGHFGLGKFSGKNSGKNGKVWKFNSKPLFSGKMAPEITFEIA
jgi:hypothetical protein